MACRVVSTHYDSSDEEPIQFVAFIDGSCKNNGYLGAQGGYGVVLLYSGKKVATVSCAMSEDDELRHTSNRAEINAAIFMMNFIHEFAIVEKPIFGFRENEHGHGPRSLDGAKVKLIVKRDSRYVKNGCEGVIRTNANCDLREKFQNLQYCMEDVVDIEFRHVRGHSGNRWNNLADKYARIASGTDATERLNYIDCEICRNAYACAQDPAVHFKETHFSGTCGVEWSGLTQQRAPFPYNAPDYDCELCTRTLFSRHALKQHMKAKHYLELDDEGQTAF